MHFQQTDLEHLTDEYINTLDKGLVLELCKKMRDDMNALEGLLNQQSSDHLESASNRQPVEQSNEPS